MSKAIWKFPALGPLFTAKMPIGSRVLSVQSQHGSPQMWALVDPEKSTELRQFAFYGTGHPMPDDPGKFVGTFQVDGGDLVFHLFDVT